MVTLPIACGIDGTVQPWDPSYADLVVNGESLSLFPFAAGALSLPNLIVNGTFDSDTAWTKGVDWTISSGRATRSGSSSSGSLTQSVAFVAGGVYEVTFTVLSYTAGSFTPRFTGGTSVNGTARSANGTYTQTMTALSGNANFAILAVSLTAGSIDNVIVRRVG